MKTETAVAFSFAVLLGVIMSQAYQLHRSIELTDRSIEQTDRAIAVIRECSSLLPPPSKLVVLFY